MTQMFTDGAAVVVNWLGGPFDGAQMLAVADYAEHLPVKTVRFRELFGQKVTRLACYRFVKRKRKNPLNVWQFDPKG